MDKKSSILIKGSFEIIDVSVIDAERKIMNLTLKDGDNEFTIMPILPLENDPEFYKGKKYVINYESVHEYGGERYYYTIE